jgi:phosphodiesterase/alkaline phosphatase D-like protein
VIACLTCRYEIVTWFDPWQSYPAERNRFYEALGPAGGNAVVYGGDTHAAYAAMLRDRPGHYVGAEYSSPGVTSPDVESGSILPIELHNAANLPKAHVRAGCLVNLCPF